MNSKTTWMYLGIAIIVILFFVKSSPKETMSVQEADIEAPIIINNTASLEKFIAQEANKSYEMYGKSELNIDTLLQSAGGEAQAGQTNMSSSHFALYIIIFLAIMVILALFQPKRGKSK